MRFDTIVVGAGPAGSTTARECAEQGLSVLLLDKAEFPRDKPCGGGITIRAASQIPVDLDPVIERTVHRVTFTGGISGGFTRSAPQKISYLTQRSRLDEFLAEQAQGAGAIFLQRESLKSVERYPDHVTVRTSNEVFEGSTLVAADGANGNTTKLAGINSNLLYGLALEGNISPHGGVPAKWQETIGFDFGRLPGGYGWVFPKAEHLNIGLGGWRYLGPTLKDHLCQLVKFHGFDPNSLWGIRGHHLPMRQAGSEIVSDNVVVVGDAAGLIDPLTGEGIYASFWSGTRAAKRIAAFLDGEEPNLEGYRLDVERGLLPELKISRQLHDISHLWPSLFVEIERRTSVLWSAVEMLLRGEWTYLTAKNKLGPLWDVLEFISDLMRVTPPLRWAAGQRDLIAPERYFRWTNRDESLII